MRASASIANLNFDLILSKTLRMVSTARNAWRSAQRALCEEKLAGIPMALDEISLSLCGGAVNPSWSLTLTSKQA